MKPGISFLMRLAAASAIAWIAVSLVTRHSDDTPVSKVERIELVNELRYDLISEKQTEPIGDREKFMRDALDCDAPALVCCDSCDVCVCEPRKLNCPPLIRGYHCAP